VSSTARCSGSGSAATGFQLGMVDQRDYIDISRRSRDETEHLQRAPADGDSS